MFVANLATVVLAQGTTGSSLVVQEQARVGWYPIPVAPVVFQRRQWHHSLHHVRVVDRRYDDRAWHSAPMKQGARLSCRAAHCAMWQDRQQPSKLQRQQKANSAKV